MGQDTFVLGGIGSQNEMINTFMLYYPRIEIEPGTMMEEQSDCTSEGRMHTRIPEFITRLMASGLLPVELGEKNGQAYYFNRTMPDVDFTDVRVRSIWEDMLDTDKTKMVFCMASKRRLALPDLRRLWAKGGTCESSCGEEKCLQVPSTGFPRVDVPQTENVIESDWHVYQYNPFEADNGAGRTEKDGDEQADKDGEARTDKDGDDGATPDPETPGPALLPDAEPVTNDGQVPIDTSVSGASHQILAGVSVFCALLAFLLVHLRRRRRTTQELDFGGI